MPFPPNHTIKQNRGTKTVVAAVQRKKKKRKKKKKVGFQSIICLWLKVKKKKKELEIQLGEKKVCVKHHLQNKCISA